MCMVRCRFSEKKRLGHHDLYIFVTKEYMYTIKASPPKQKKKNFTVCAPRAGLNYALEEGMHALPVLLFSKLNETFLDILIQIFKIMIYINNIFLGWRIGYFGIKRTTDLCSPLQTPQKV